MSQRKSVHIILSWQGLLLGTISSIVNLTESFTARAGRLQQFQTVIPLSKVHILLQLWHAARQEPLSQWKTHQLWWMWCWMSPSGGSVNTDSEYLGIILKSTFELFLQVYISVCIICTIILLANSPIGITTKRTVQLLLPPLSWGGSWTPFTFVSADSMHLL